MVRNNSHHDLVSVQQLDAAAVLHKIKLATAFQNGLQIQLKRPVYAMNLFFENSTRTHTSFEMAEQRLGLGVISFQPSSSSMTKGESLLDTLKTIQAIGVDLAVVRHQQNAYYTPILAADLDLSLINAGDGSGEHPSQSLLDMMTIYQEFGHFAGLKVGIIGDIAHSRVARSNAELLTQLDAQVAFAGPESWFPNEFNEFGPHVTVDQLVMDADVIMLLRVQHERLSETAEDGFDTVEYHQAFGLTKERIARLQPQAIIMHPGPVNRGVEIDSDLVESKHSRIFKQMTNGMLMRMAIITDILAARQLITPFELGGSK
ncbi:aspartate carbamoyltransferase catalytic subunit [Lapidilactobacillus bayanensis]|uniref:aspartate carbamoyltransferase catalytic subunit n=1 Tax=Lapidilactobacillus bayanensis TaxID=2485998 RepID=UPI000F7AF991|nr:aspartate carbamoyltransferase catalytic subunit [Lapidilactobacillus bayanensis]